MNIDKLVRPNINRLSPYSSARNEFTGTAAVFLDANENPFNAPYNRYPDPLQKNVKEKLAAVKGVKPENIFLGAGSDEGIDLAYRIFCRPNIDNAVAIAPSYGMYEVCADINDIEYRKVQLDDNFCFTPADLLAATDENTKLIWICSPNNPTGNAASTDIIKTVAKGFNGIVMVDEAYIDFSNKGSMLEYLADYPNVIVLQTFSKAWGCAGLRLGAAFASPEIIDYYNKVKYPYNLNTVTQELALQALEDRHMVKVWVEELIESRTHLADELKDISCVKRIYPSDANFILVKVDNPDNLYSYLCQNGIIVRNRNRVEKCAGCLRITIGTIEENTQLLNAIKEYERK
ncbi:MAG: histidinol-phosphate transaminase [Muribaculaceae bacterium]|nr:histidinol-phosphate transaminase [Muribaculaceae bacterium]